MQTVSFKEYEAAKQEIIGGGEYVESVIGPNSRGQTSTVRLTLRLPERIETELRKEAARRGDTLNQTVLRLVRKRIHELFNEISPCSSS
ncbi:MAG: hypothetical protein LBL83_11365 [Clostridiales bacterium]|jgi:hypothetical protein|nr:hypothetical protein [Clostridiales bacterium]